MPPKKSTPKKEPSKKKMSTKEMAKKEMLKKETPKKETPKKPDLRLSDNANSRSGNKKHETIDPEDLFYLLVDSDLPKVDTTRFELDDADGTYHHVRTVLQMMEGDEDILDDLEDMDKIPGNDGEFSRLVIKAGNPSLVLTLKRASTGEFMPKVIARYKNEKDNWTYTDPKTGREAQYKLKERFDSNKIDKELVDYRLTAALWHEAMDHLGMDLKEAWKCYQNFLVRVWRYNFMEAPIWVAGRRSSGNKKKKEKDEMDEEEVGTPTKSSASQKRRRDQSNAESGRARRPNKKAKTNALSTDFVRPGDDSLDEDNGIKDEEDAADRSLDDHYGFQDTRQYWDAYDKPTALGRTFDLSDAQLCDKIADGYIDYAEEGQTRARPTADLLRRAARLHGQAPAAGRRSTTAAFRDWVSKNRTGDAEDVKRVTVPSLERRAAERQTALQTAEAAEHKALAAWAVEYFGKLGINMALIVGNDNP